MAEQRSVRLPSLEQIKHVHIVGVCGTLMGAFAAFLKRRGLHVTGSDQNVYPPMSDVLRQAGIELFSGYAAENLTAQKSRPDLVVIGNVIQSSNPEARAAIDGGYAYTSLPEAMEKLMLERTRNLVVAGTHGKTTTSSLLAHVLNRCGRDPNFFIGGVSLDLPFSFQANHIEPGHPFVLEGDEYDTAFWDKVPKFNHYLPNDAILTSVEFDHADIYADFAAVQRAFEGLLTRIRAGGRLIWCTDYPVIAELIGRAKLAESGKVEIVTYGPPTPKAPGGPAPRFTPGRVRTEGEWTLFDVLDAGQKRAEVRMRLPGMHNVLNALAVWIEATSLGIPGEQAAAALGTFQGVKRRQEVRGEVRGVMVIDDFAHHPTAVRETLRALRSKYPGRRLVTVFEPRSATSRRKVFQKDYAAAFGEADSIFIATPYDQTRIKAEDQFSSDQLVGDLTGAGKDASVMPTVADGVLQVAKQSRSGDVVAVLSNGGFEGFIPKLLEALK